MLFFMGEGSLLVITAVPFQKVPTSDRQVVEWEIVIPYASRSSVSVPPLRRGVIASLFGIVL